MSASHTLRDNEVVLFLKAACCVIAADGRVRSAEVKSLSKELDKLGVSHSEPELTALVVEYSKAIHSAKPPIYAEKLAPSLASLRGTKWGAALTWALANISGSDDARHAQESDVVRVLSRAVETGSGSVRTQNARTQNAPIRAASMTPEARNQLIGCLIPLVFGAVFFWYLLAPALTPGLVYGLPKVSVAGPQANWVSFSDWQVQMNGNRLEATISFTPPSQPTLFPHCKVNYTTYDKKGVKLDFSELAVPKLSPGEKARATFYIDNRTKRIDIFVYSL